MQKVQYSPFPLFPFPQGGRDFGEKKNEKKERERGGKGGKKGERERGKGEGRKGGKGEGKGKGEGGRWKGGNGGRRKVLKQQIAKCDFGY